MSVKDCDSHKLMYHPRHLTSWLDNNPSPLHAEIGVTNKCNHRCKFCTLDWITRGVDVIDKDILLKTIKDMARMGVKSIYYAGEGEPTLHSNISDFIEYGKSLGISQSISTNGTLFNKNMAEKTLPHLSWIRFSLDAATEDTYSKIHGVNGALFNTVIKNIETAVNIKKANDYNVDIGIQLILMPENINEIETLAKYCKSIGVDNFQVKPAHSHPKSSYTPGIYNLSQQTLKENLEKLEDDKFTVVVRVKSMERLVLKRNYERCHGFDFYIIIDAKGNIVPCNIFYDNKDYIFGNLYKNTFEEIWNSQERKDVINKIEQSKHCMCGDYRCRLDVLNRYLERVKVPETNDEFI